MTQQCNLSKKEIDKVKEKLDVKAEEKKKQLRDELVDEDEIGEN